MGKHYIYATDKYGTLRFYDENLNLHREDGPALIRARGTQEWFYHGIRHREGGPAVKIPGGYDLYYHRGEIHRGSGPAAVKGFGQERYFFRTKEYIPSNPRDQVKTVYAVILKEIANGVYSRLFFNGEGKRHRELDEGPALEVSNGKYFYYLGQEVIKGAPDPYRHADFDSIKRVDGGSTIRLTSMSDQALTDHSRTGERLEKTLERILGYKVMFHEIK